MMNRSALLIGQLLVVLLALGVRVLAPGWWLVIVFMSLGVVAVIVLAPLLVAVSVAAALAPTLRPRSLLALAAADLSLLAFALTLPDFTDVPDRYPVPLATLATGDGEVSRAAADTFGTVAGCAVLTYVAAAALTVVFAVLDQRRTRRGTPPPGFPTLAVA
ncbi:hypothetical protein IU501_31580 [Nocardia otitidiscaviarum]|uniref:hypothetical protein n=2 Tax=Nocardia otitidiscaviarum TaxID=1823 RepID=UPI0004A72C75|nr:hypothetical protein [Nocardia otitidiscaviarum]MBF6137519.1 hypothetical protein [Nocardia otitidiscaviarum]MBF6241787.1 hypothetical protein [Nocardia otitidiscaviarum]MBF6488219.1 hypothetical protein [Nocardia otitidiscaviarum]